MDYDPQQKPSLEAVSAQLRTLDSLQPIPADVYYGLSGLVSSEIERLKPDWLALESQQRRRVLAALLETAEANFEMDYRALGHLSLSDTDAAVRLTSIDLLWEDETLELYQKLRALAASDPSTEVRASALGALGRFVLKGEMDELPAGESDALKDFLLSLYDDIGAPLDVRRRALEALAHGTHERVPTLIRQAYTSDEHLMRVSALFAMGVSCDTRWEDAVLAELDNEDSELRYEAARAAGELELGLAVPRLARLLIEEDREIQETAIWALGEIGGREAVRVLSAMMEIAEEQGDDALLDAIDEAIENASFEIGGLFSLDDLE